MIDVIIIIGYFVGIMLIGVLSRNKSTEVSADEYFLSSRSLKWPSIAISTISTNIHAGHFLGMMGSAYLYGLAQAGLEINAIFGILVATFFFVPLYLKLKVTTISQFFEGKFGPRVAVAYSGLSMLLFSTLYLGSTLYWGAYAVDALFGENLVFISTDAMTRICVLLAALGIFSAVYTWLGGLTAVVRTDIVQFVLLLVGGCILLYLAIDKLGGIDQLWKKTPQLMHLHLPADHPKLPWTAVFSMLLLNLNYWGCNQVILQRALAAKDLKNAQIGLLVGGVLKYFMAAIIIIPGIALAGLLIDNPLADPDKSFVTLVNMLLPQGLRGIILVGLFASLMSSVDSMFNSLSTLWSIDIYKRYINPKATDAQVINKGKMAIVSCLISGCLFGFLLAYVKFSSPELALTHWFNDISFYIKNGFVVLICSAVFMVRPNKNLVFAALFTSIVICLGLKYTFPAMAYFNRSMYTILLTLSMVGIPTIMKNGWRLPNKIIHASSSKVAWSGVALLISWLILHVIFH